MTKHDPSTGPEGSLPTSPIYLSGTKYVASSWGPSTPTSLPIDKEVEHVKQSFTACFDN
jgi:hypothetical protein